MRMMLRFLLLAALALPAYGASRDIEVTESIDTGGQSGRAQAGVTIHAAREAVWSLITSCGEAKSLVPGLESCQVLETAPDRTWQRIRHVVDYSWYVPKITYEFRATYAYPTRISIERESGDLRVLHGSWQLDSAGGDTRATYSVDLAPGFWVPRWLVRFALRHDLPRMLEALRADAEAIQGRQAG